VLGNIGFDRPQLIFFCAEMVQKGWSVCRIVLVLMFTFPEDRLIHASEADDLSLGNWTLAVKEYYPAMADNAQQDGQACHFNHFQDVIYKAALLRVIGKEPADLLKLYGGGLGEGTDATELQRTLWGLNPEGPSKGIVCAAAHNLYCTENNKCQSCECESKFVSKVRICAEIAKVVQDRKLEGIVKGPCEDESVDGKDKTGEGEGDSSTDKPGDDKTNGPVMSSTRKNDDAGTSGVVTFAYWTSCRLILIIGALSTPTLI